MNHKQIFTKIGRAFETPRKERTPRQIFLARSGICIALPCEAITDEVFYKFDKIINSKDDYWLPIPGDTIWQRIYDLIRADFCYLLAAMSKQEFEELGK